MPTICLIPAGPQGLIGYGTLLNSRSRVTWLKAPPSNHQTFLLPLYFFWKTIFHNATFQLNTFTSSSRYSQAPHEVFEALH